MTHDWFSCKPQFISLYGTSEIFYGPRETFTDFRDLLRLFSSRKLQLRLRLRIRLQLRMRFRLWLPVRLRKCQKKFPKSLKSLKKSEKSQCVFESLAKSGTNIFKSHKVWQSSNNVKISGIPLGSTSCCSSFCSRLIYIWSLRRVERLRNSPWYRGDLSMISTENGQSGWRTVIKLPFELNCIMFASVCNISMHSTKNVSLMNVHQPLWPFSVFNKFLVFFNLQQISIDRANCAGRRQSVFAIAIIHICQLCAHTAFVHSNCLCASSFRCTVDLFDVYIFLIS